jgi:hypothetical protein
VKKKPIQVIMHIYMEMSQETPRVAILNKNVIFFHVAILNKNVIFFFFLQNWRTRVQNRFYLGGLITVEGRWWGKGVGG